MGKDYELVVGIDKSGEIIEVKKSKRLRIKKVRLEFKLQDFWVGAFWKSHTDWNFLGGWELRITDVWVCLVPCFPLHIRLVKEVKIT